VRHSKISHPMTDAVIRVISSVRKPLPVHTQHEKYRCVAANRRSGPRTDTSLSFDYLVGAREQHGRDGEAERPRGR
jgi:hypothetical protein